MKATTANKLSKLFKNKKSISFLSFRNCFDDVYMADFVTKKGEPFSTLRFIDSGDSYEDSVEVTFAKKLSNITEEEIQAKKNELNIFLTDDNKFVLSPSVPSNWKKTSL